MKKLFIAAGEASGDTHAAHLLAALRQHHPALEVFGLGGAELAALGCRLIYDLPDLAVTGFWEVAKRLPHFRRVFNNTVAAVEAERPDLVLLVDYPGLNLRLARTLHEKGFKVVYYILPQVWAWKPKRARVLEESCDLLLSILPFEQELFDQSKVRCEFVGHPLLDLIGATEAQDSGSTPHGPDKRAPLLALLPGSRKVEVARHYLVMLKAVRRLRKRFTDLQVATLRRAELGAQIYDQLEKSCDVVPTEWQGDRYDLLKAAKLAFVASGTATLEAALCGTPLCVVYKTGWLSAIIARSVLKLDSVGLVNIVAGRRIAPEFLQGDLTVDNLYRFGNDLLSNEANRKQMIADLQTVRERLGNPGAAACAAKLILEVANR
ncbi:MAG: lipid-A-disaccharide synthase [bacterium]